MINFQGPIISPSLCLQRFWTLVLPQRQHASSPTQPLYCEFFSGLISKTFCLKDQKEMNSLWLLTLLGYLNFTSAVCTEEVCYRCNAIVNMNRAYRMQIFPTWSYRCERILKIKYCCSGFYGSWNTLGA